jgi:hypothetical protein
VHGLPVFIYFIRNLQQVYLQASAFFFLGPEMKGDTLKVFIKVIFNNDLGLTEENEHVLNIIVDP